MSADPSLKSSPVDQEFTSFQKINSILDAMIVAQNLPPSPTDSGFSSLQKINDLLWSMLNRGGAGLWYGNCAAVALPANSTVIVVPLVGSGKYGNVDLLATSPQNDGVLFNGRAIAQVNFWGTVTDSAYGRKWCGIQTDRQKGAVDPAKVVVRAQATFLSTLANITFSDLLDVGDIVRGVIYNSQVADSFSQGYLSVIAWPVN